MNMKALISTTEQVLTGYRVAQVAQDGEIFPVADTMFWIGCTDDTVADQFWFDPQDSQIKSIAQSEIVPVVEIQPEIIDLQNEGQ